MFSKLVLLSVVVYLFSSGSIFAGDGDITVITIDNYIINPIVKEYIEHSLHRAEKARSECLIIQLNTPGGTLNATQEIVKLLLNSAVPVVVYITPRSGRAASAGAFISYAAHVLAMSPATHIGAAHPVMPGVAFGKGRSVMQDKVLKDTLAWARNISQARFRPSGALEAMVKESRSFTETEAYNQRIIDCIAEDINDLLEQLQGFRVYTRYGPHTLNTTGRKLTFISLTKRQEFLNYLTGPNIAYILFIMGVLGVIFEVTHPGFGVSGVAGIICLLLALYGFSVLPVNYAGLALIVAGCIFLVVEAFTPSFGLFALGGITSFVLGSLVLFSQPGFIKTSLSVTIPAACILLLFMLFLISRIIKLQFTRPLTGPQALIGKKCLVYEDISKVAAVPHGYKGKVFIRGEIWDARSREEALKGEEVEIIAVEGLVLLVKKHTDKGGQDAF